MEVIKNSFGQYKELSPMTKEHDEAVDVIVPDVNPDVLSIVYTNAVCAVREKTMVTGRLTVSGEITAKAFYIGEEELHCITGQIPFSYTYDAPVQPGDVAVISVRAMSSGAGMLNPRKLCLKAGICVDIRMFRKTALELAEDAFGAPDEGINTLTERESIRYMCGVAEKRIAFNEEIRIMGGEIDERDKLLRSELMWMTEDVKVLTNKIMLRGNAVVKVVTINGGSLRVTENTYRLPFSQIIESDGVEPSDSAEIDYQTMQFDAQMLSRADGDMYLYCNIFGNASVLVTRSAEVKLLSDMYSTAYDMTFDVAEVSAGIEEPVTIQAEAGGTIEVDPAASRICDFHWCQRARVSADVITACFNFTVMYQDERGGVYGAVKRIDVDLPHPAPGSGGVKTEAKAVRVEVTSQGVIEISFTAAVTVSGICRAARNQVTGCKLDKTSPRGRVRDASLVLRSVEDGESVWSVAKQYATTPSAILSANSLESEAGLTPGRLIMIPFVK